MKYSFNKNVDDTNYYFDSINSPYLVEAKMKVLFAKIDFIKHGRVNAKIDKDGLYSFYRDNFRFFLTISNTKYVAHLLKEEETIEDIFRSWIPFIYDVSYEIVYNEEG